MAVLEPVPIDGGPTTQPIKALSFPWKMRADDLSPEQANLGADEAVVSMLVEVPWSYLHIAVAEILGYPYLSGGFDGGEVKLRRVLPWNCPWATWLFSSRCGSIRGDKFLGKVGGPEVGGHYSAYDVALITVVFTPPRWRVLTDEQADTKGGEWTRFVEKRSRPGVEVLEIERGAMKYTGAGNPFVDSVPKSRITRLVGKRDLEWVWRQVPRDYIFSPTTGREENILAALAAPVNEFEFDGYPAGTLLLMEAQLDPETPAVQPAFLNPSDPTDPNRTYSLTLRFKDFDPPRDPGVTYPLDYTGRGHCLLPAPGLATRFYYPALSKPVDGVGGDEPLYQASPFANIFKRPD